MAKPTFILVPGAWHTPEGFSSLTRLLTKQGYEVDTVSLASTGSSNPRLGFDEDVNNIVAIIGKHADMGSDIVLCLHSYSGLPGSSACKSVLKTNREAEGRVGGVIHVVYIAAFAVNEGICLMDGLGGVPMPWWKFDDEKSSMTAQDPIPIFYNDIKDERTLQELVADLKAQTYSAFFGKATFAPWLEINATYIMCSKDNALPFEGQKDMVANANKVIEDCGHAGIKMNGVTLDTSHTPFVSQPKRVAEILRRAAGEI